jgi:hypothetical protein
MTGRVLELDDIIQPDHLATQITDQWLTWDQLRQSWKSDKEEVRRYVFATDTTQTTNSQLPWKNKTTIPKLCQIADNLYANYMYTLFPNRKSIIWEANERDAASPKKRDAITNYMNWVMSQPGFKHEMDKILLDYILFGNCFVTVEWLDQRVQQDETRTQHGYIGPAIKRINPNDIVFNPAAETFIQSPKIVRSYINLGELREMLERLSNDDNREEYESLWTYLKDLRSNAESFQGDWVQRDNLYAMDGFGTFRDYLRTDTVEVLTFYGDIYDRDKDILLKNHVITVVDRHKLINKKPNPSFFGYPPIFHSAWRKKQDNLWGMGPLDNLVGMQYRLDHVENMKADIFDLTRFPVQKVKGFVEDYTWQPGEKIYVSEEGDVDLVAPDVQVLQANFELDRLEMKMEEMAGAPREAMGFRTPGEKTKYEVQSMENAAARIFQNKTYQISEQVIEPSLNACLELARRHMTGATTIKVFDDEFNHASFQALTVEDITGIGRIKPVAARHFAEQAQLIQNLTNLSQSNLFPMLQPHMSSVKLAKLFEGIFNLGDHEIFLPYVALSEQAEAQKQMQALEEQVAMETQTASGIGEDFDLDPALMQQMQDQQMQMMQGQ